MPVIIGLLGEEQKSKAMIAKIMEDNFSIKNNDFDSILKTICANTFYQLSMHNFDDSNVDVPFEKQDGAPLPMLRENAKKIMTGMVKALGNDYRAYFNDVSSGKYAGGTYNSPRELMNRVDEIIREMIPDFYCINLTKELGIDDVVVASINTKYDFDSLRGKYANFFPVEVNNGSKDSKKQKQWWDSYLFNTLQYKKPKSDDDMKNLVSHVEKLLKEVKNSCKKEIPYPTENFMDGGEIVSNKGFVFESR